MRWVAWTAAWALSLCPPVRAAEGEDHEQRIQELEQQNQELRERLDRVEEEDAAQAAEVDAYVQEGLGLNLVIHRGNTHGVFQIFGDVGAAYNNPEVEGRSNGYFLSGGIDLFLTARFGDHFHALSETVFLTTLSEPRDTGSFDQERLWGAWAFSDRFQIKLGLEHGPISRWNNLYHHGKWLELTTDRPLLARFEGSGGILPMHNSGVELTGTIPSSRGRFNWVVFVSNGRGRVPTDTQEFSDRNDAKAIDVGGGWAPGSVENLWMGLFFRADKIAPNASDPLRQGSIQEYIGSFQLDYRGERIEVLGEFAYIENQDEQSDQDFGHWSTYLQLGYRVGDRWTPYTRVDFREMDQGDPYFASVDRDLDVWEWLVGVRFDFISNAALKLEVGFGEREERDDGAAVSTRGYTRIALQLAFVF
jgi:hypothetical protein